jgi:transcriptional regulator with XRE-family HTH domain
VVVVSMAGRMVRHARRRAGLTQRQLAARAGIPQETIARIERGRSDPRVNTLDRLLAATSFGLEVMPRLGIGVDRTQINAMLDRPMVERLAWAIESDGTYIEMRRSMRRDAE